jgi:hypothetical protein
MIPGLSQLADLPTPKPGDPVLDWIIELARRANRRIEGPQVVMGPQGWLIRDPEPEPPDWFPFELYNDIAPGGTNILAWPLNADYSRYSMPNPPTIQVNDGILGDVRAYGSNHGWSTATRGAIGIALNDGQKLQIVSIKRLSKQLEGLTTGSVATNVSITVNTVVTLDDGQSPVAQTNDTLTVANPFGWGTSSAYTRIDFKPDGAGGWTFDQGPCGT